MYRYIFIYFYNRITIELLTTQIYQTINHKLLLNKIMILNYKLDNRVSLHQFFA
jgi:hypothetical protein